MTLTAASFAALDRSYANALHLLSLLPTNRDVTSLFEVQTPSSTGSKDGDDLNSRALPEFRAWLARAGYADPARDFGGLRCVHVAGTKGKGSVCAFVTALLLKKQQTAPKAIGRVGTYLSPHVLSVRERLWLDGQPIRPSLFAQYVFELWERLSLADVQKRSYGPDSKPFYFRFLTLLALHVFVREGVRSAVVECGIGGEYDPTNTLPATSVSATAVSQLGIDHVAMLGHTLDAIAWHKAGIFKPGVAAFVVQQGDDKTMQVLRERAVEKGASKLYEIPAEQVARWPGIAGAALPGDFQKSNMALAAAAAQEHFRVVGVEGAETDIDLDPAHISPELQNALAQTTLRGRCETVHDTDNDIEWLVDGAHTADSLEAVARYFSTRPFSSSSSLSPRNILVFTVRDRDVARLVQAVIIGAGKDFFYDALFVFSQTEQAAARVAASEALASVSPATGVGMLDTIAGAVQWIRNVAATETRPVRVLATGSFVVAREVLQELLGDEEDEEKKKK